MGAVVQNGPLTLTANSALGPFLRVMLSASKLVVAGAQDEEVGVLDQRVLAADDIAAVVPLNLAPALRMVAGAAITQYASVYGAADGKIKTVVNNNFIGTALEAASGDGSFISVAPSMKITAPGALDGPVIIDDDFTHDYPAAATAFPLGGTPWLKTETLGLGVTEVASPNGIIKLAADAVAEAAIAAIHMPSLPFDIDKNPIAEFRLAIFDIGDNAAVDINFGLASATHATDFDLIAVFAAFHLDSPGLSVFCQSDDGTIDTAPVDTLVDLVDDVMALFQVDCTDKADVKFSINGVRVLAGTTFDISNYTGQLTPIVHVEKTSNDSTFDVRVDRIRCQADRN